MEKAKQEFNSELMKLYDRYGKELEKVSALNDVTAVGVRIQKDMAALNVKYRLWDPFRGYDHDSIYYTASFIAENSTSPEICRLDATDLQNRKELLSELLFREIDKCARKKIHAIEPHPDDVLGSASGLCYSAGANVVLHTITKTADERDHVTLGKDMLHKYKSVRKIPNIIEHHKYD
ncbi:MAG: hypothetical protein K2P59_09720, partial [Acetatifactor sp.]|nr:hypothetical protein [Acetatifactor sp.]